MQGGNLSPRSPKKRQLPAENGWRPKRLRRFRRTLSSTVGGQQGPAKKVLVVVEELMGQLLGHEQSFYFRKPVEEDQDLDEVFLQMCVTLCSGAPARSSRAPSPQACERGAGGCPAGGACFHFGCGGLLRALFLSPHPFSPSLLLSFFSLPPPSLSLSRGPPSSTLTATRRQCRSAWTCAPWPRSWHTGTF